MIRGTNRIRHVPTAYSGGIDMSCDLHLCILGKSEIIREGLRRILTDQGFVIDATEPTCADFGDLTCDVILVDANEPSEGIQYCVDLRDRFPKCRIVLMMDKYHFDDVARAFATGAVDGYLIKAMSCAPLAGALRLIAMGQKVMPSEMALSLTSSIPQIRWSTREVHLTGMPVSDRETEILRCLVNGEPNKVISRRLSIAEATVKVHIKAILRKLRVQNRTQAAVWAADRGLTVPQPVPPRLLIAS